MPNEEVVSAVKLEVCTALGAALVLVLSSRFKQREQHEQSPKPGQAAPRGEGVVCVWWKVRLKRCLDSWLSTHLTSWVFPTQGRGVSLLTTEVHSGVHGLCLIASFIYLLFLNTT